MKVIYFNIENGKCVKPYTLIPSHRAFITGTKIHMIEACFNVHNISSNGYEWFQDEVKKEYEDWVRFPNIMKELKKLVLKENLRCLFKHSNFKLTTHRFPYVPFWIDGMKYSYNHYIDEASDKLKVL